MEYQYNCNPRYNVRMHIILFYTMCVGKQNKTAEAKLVPKLGAAAAAFNDEV